MEPYYWYSVTLGLNQVHFLPSFYSYRGAFRVNAVLGSFLPKIRLLIETDSDESVNMSLNVDLSQSSSVSMNKGR